MSALHALRWSAARIASGGAILLAIFFPCGRLASAWAQVGPVEAQRAIAQNAAQVGRDADDDAEDGDQGSDERPEIRPAIAQGRELFLHEWAPGDKRARGGDGLGPVFNARSCVACHSQGGVGGGGSRESNVNVLSATGPWTQTKVRSMHPGLANNRRVVLHLSGVDRAYEAWRKHRLDLTQIPSGRADPLSQPLAHPAQQVSWSRSSSAFGGAEFMPVSMQIQQAFARQAKVVDAMQNGGAIDPVEMGFVTPTMDTSGASARTQPGTFGADDSRGVSGLALSERNTTALFGLGRVDAIADSVIEEVAREELRDTPHTAGRISRLPGNRIGRFGWHAQQASLADFTLTACAVEVGLDLPDHPQAGDPRKPNYRAPGWDMDAADCAALVAYVADLPAPAIADFGMVRSEKQKTARAGRALFKKIGCADCHRETMGEVAWFYSDLLLHDMGVELRDGAYGAFAPHGAPVRETAKEALTARKQVVDLSRGSDDELLWRTPPLWGVASSAPYLHDGRAATLLDAVELHGGQGLASAQTFSRLNGGEQNAVLTFLTMLIAPPSAERVSQPIHGWGFVSGAMRQTGGGCVVPSPTPRDAFAGR